MIVQPVCLKAPSKSLSWKNMYWHGLSFSPWHQVNYRMLEEVPFCQTTSTESAACSSTGCCLSAQQQGAAPERSLWFQHQLSTSQTQRCQDSQLTTPLSLHSQPLNASGLRRDRIPSLCHFSVLHAYEDFSNISDIWWTVSIKLSSGVSISSVTSGQADLSSDFEFSVTWWCKSLKETGGKCEKEISLPNVSTVGSVSTLAAGIVWHE